MSKIVKQACNSHNDKSEDQEIIRVMKWIRTFFNREPLDKIKALEQQYNQEISTLTNRIDDILEEFNKIRGDYNDVSRMAQKVLRAESDELDVQFMNIVNLLKKLDDFLMNNNLGKVQVFKTFSDYLYSILTQNEQEMTLLYQQVCTIKEEHASEIDFTSILGDIEQSASIRDYINNIVGPDKSIADFLVNPKEGTPFDSKKHDIAVGETENGAPIEKCYLFGVYHNDRGAQQKAKVTIPKKYLI